jgi:hypothetical protein
VYEAWWLDVYTRRMTKGLASARPFDEYTTRDLNPEPAD